MSAWNKRGVRAPPARCQYRNRCRSRRVNRVCQWDKGRAAGRCTRAGIAVSLGTLPDSVQPTVVLNRRRHLPTHLSHRRCRVVSRRRSDGDRSSGHQELPGVATSRSVTLQTIQRPTFELASMAANKTVCWILAVRCLSYGRRWYTRVSWSRPATRSRLPTGLR